MLREAVFRKAGPGRPPLARVLSRREIVPEADGHLARVTGVLLSVGHKGTETRLLVQTDGKVLEAMLEQPVDGETLSWQPGAQVEITGLCAIKYDELKRPSAGQLLLQSAADVRVIEPAPWLTAGRAIGVSSALAAAALGGWFWGITLRRRVRRQTEQIREQIEKEKATQRARDLTPQLLTFAKGGEPVREAAVLPDIVRESASFVLRGSAVRAESDIAADLWPANVDKGQIGQVVQNIVINARQAMPGGGVVRITMRNAEIVPGGSTELAAGRYLSLEIADTGEGIAPEVMTRIFEPYFTTRQQGSGLGLATVFSIVKKHLGHITVASVRGEGTRFRIWLPAASAPVVEKPATPAASCRGRSRAGCCFSTTRRPSARWRRRSCRGRG